MTRGSCHMSLVAELGCLICSQLGFDASPAEAHHCFDTSERNDMLTVPLCPEHHRGATGFHGMGERAFNAAYKTSEKKLLALTIERLSVARLRGRA